MIELAMTIAAAAFATGLYALAFRRSGKAADAKQLGPGAIQLSCSAAPADVFRSIAAIGPPYKCDASDVEKMVLVLSSQPSVWSYGFLYPIVLHERDGGGTNISVGVKSRLIHIGPGMGIAQSRCVQAIQALFSVPPARLNP